MIKAINLRFEKASKKQKVIEKQKREIVVAKYWKNRREMNLPSQEDEDDSNISNCI